MQAAPLPSVLNSESVLPTTMTDTPQGAHIEGPRPDSATSDERLMLDFSKGQTEAFTELFRRYKQPVFGFFRRRLTDAARAEELTQETFVAILRGASRYQPQALFRTYLYAIAFKILRAHRRRAAFRATFLGKWKGSQDPPGRDATDSALVLRQALGRLDVMDREILMLRQFEGLSYTEIAELLKIPVNTVRSRLFRARITLRELLSSPAPRPSGAKITESEESV